MHTADRERWFLLERSARDLIDHFRATHTPLCCSSPRETDNKKMMKKRKKKEKREDRKYELRYQYSCVSGVETREGAVKSRKMRETALSLLPPASTSPSPPITTVFKSF